MTFSSAPPPPPGTPVPWSLLLQALTVSHGAEADSTFRDVLSCVMVFKREVLGEQAFGLLWVVSGQACLSVAAPRPAAPPQEGERVGLCFFPPPPPFSNLDFFLLTHLCRVNEFHNTERGV